MSNPHEKPLTIPLRQRLEALEARVHALEVHLYPPDSHTLEAHTPDDPPFQTADEFVLWWYRTIIQRDATLEDAYAGLKKDGVKATPCTCSASYCRGWQIVSDYTSATPRIPMTPPWEVLGR